MNRRLVAVAAVVAALGAAIGCGGSRRALENGQVQTPRLPPVNPDALAQFDRGMRALRLGGRRANERAKPRLEQAVAIDKNLWEAWHNLGVIHYADGEDDAAARAFSKALRINPAHTPALLARAEAYRRALEFDKARTDYKQALARDEQDAQIHVRHASLLREHGRLDDALDAAREALRYSTDPPTFVELGMIYLAQGRDDLAELVLRKALAADNKLPAAWNALALVSIARGNDQLAFEHFDAATQLDSSFRDARFNKATVLMQAGDYAAAVDELAAVVKGDREDWGAHVALGVAQRGNGEHARSKRTWEGVVKRAPKRSRARGDALFNLAVLAMDFGDRDETDAKSTLERYLQETSKRHSKRKQARERLKELGQ